MTNALIPGRSYLSLHRRMIIGRSIAAAVAGVVPVPLLDDWLVSSVRRSTISRIADAHGVDLDEDAVRAIADGFEEPPKWHQLVGGGLAVRVLSSQWKKLLVAVLAARRAQFAATEFEVATCFDHYCARVHVGFGLDGDKATFLRKRIDQARAITSGGLSNHMFRRGLVAAVKSSARAPRELADMLTGGRLTKLLQGDSEIEATTEVDEALEKQLGLHTSFLARSAAAIELQLAVDQNPYLDDLLDCFDKLCRQDES